MLGNREVYKDSFAPPPPSRTLKAYERAPVSAHAGTRLQGQKIWKKVGLPNPHSRSQDNKENSGYDEARAELEREGKGSRKKPRVKGAKVDMRDASWLDAATATERAVAGEENALVVSPRKADRLEGEFVPRKRTNMDRVITPRKPLRQTTLNGSAQTVMVPLKAHSQSPEKMGGSPVRRRKSIRKSLRRSTRGKGEEEVLVSAEETVVGDRLQDTSKDQSKGPEIREFELQIPIETVKLEETVEDRLAPVNSISLEVFPETTDITLEADTKQEIPSLELVTCDAAAKSETVVEDQIIPATTTNPELVGNNSIAQSPKASEEPSEQLATPFKLVDQATEPAPKKPVKTPKNRKGSRRSTRQSNRIGRASSLPTEVSPEAKLSENLEDEPSKIPAVTSDPNDKEVSETSLSIADGDAKQVDSLDRLDTSDQPLVLGNLEPSTSIVETMETSGASPVDPAQSEVASEDKDHEVVVEGDAAVPIFAVNQIVEELLSIPVTPTHTEYKTHSSSMADSRAEELGTPTDVAEIFTVNSERTYEPESLVTLDTSLIPIESIETPEEQLEGAADFAVNDKESTAAEPTSIESPISQNLPDEAMERIQSELNEDSIDSNEIFEPILITVPLPEELLVNSPAKPTAEPTEPSSAAASSTNYDHDDTDMLRKFLTRVQANKAAKESSLPTSIPKRKRSLPHSPLRLPLGDTDTNLSSPTPEESNSEEINTSPPPESPKKRKKQHEPTSEDDNMATPKSIRRSGRTRLPVIKAPPLGAKSSIPLRRLQDGNTTVTLRRNEEKDLAALTKINTLKNKGGALKAVDVLARKAEEKDDPVLRQRSLKESFELKSEREKRNRKARKSVVWKEELVEFQGVREKKTLLDGIASAGKKLRLPTVGALSGEKEKIGEKTQDKEGGEAKEKMTGQQVVDFEEGKNKLKEVGEKDKEKSKLRVGVKSGRIALGMAVNGTPAPKRKGRGRL